MNKISLIIAREYLVRVRKKSFIIMSILGPLLFGMLFIVPVWLATREGEVKEVDVIDESGLFTNSFGDNGELQFKLIAESLESAKSKLANSGTYGLLYIPAITAEAPGGVQFYSYSKPSISDINRMEGIIRQRLESIKLENSGISQEVLDNLKVNVDIGTISISEEGEKESNSGAATVIGYVASIMIYFFIFFYGAQIMRGIIDEKNTRIVEVIISSVKPTQLMIGKIVGIGAVGLTQLALWVILTSLIGGGIKAAFGVETTSPVAQTQVMAPAAAEAIEQDESKEMVTKVFNSLETLNFPKVIAIFIFYFIGGYLVYGALFAAVGSAVDTEVDSQQFMLPITIPLILSMVVLGVVLDDPHGSVAFWMSMIPLTSPIIMMMRVPFDVPTWQLLLSMALLVGCFFFTSWLAGRIYRVGILMHGSKVNYKVLAKWFMMKN